ncbi:N-methyl-L-tryptophan oxidase [Paenibacillus psychroresistens]|uniref:N-methyl-L-tryptophan oxidase n=1 Tax=Paenibacillus psychroresistens TaxID=1778678 RepID=A0A6B8RFE2_9BACL|nr:N-methyl-L-tryptophan oxidase [Paenibacillus psychroresistens]QGQ95211.1 N-methyl-L-tryptophan oxidase [Paenibacillus psychroresistens]
MQEYDVIVVGAGAMGMSAGYYLAGKGCRTLLIDADNPPHRNGTHHGETRIIRHAYGEGREYTPMALRAQALWGELEDETNRKLFLQTGFLQTGEPGSQMLTEMMDSAEEHKLPVEILDAAEMSRRWPGVTFPEKMIGCYEADSGIMLCEECIKAFRESAILKGAELKVMTPVTDIRPDREGVTVITSEATYRAKAVIVTAGKFAGGLLSQIGLTPPLDPIRKAVGWFGTETDEYDSTSFPAFLFDLPEGVYYGFPSIDGSGVKVGRHDGEHRPAPAEKALPEFGAYPDDEFDLKQYMQQYMPQAAKVLLKGSSCTYTMTPDEHFIIDRHPDYPHVVIGAGFSGHGFKFASVIGEILSQLATGEQPRFDLKLFSLKRFQKLSTKEG